MQDDLKNFLNSWNPSVPEPPDFRRNVWLRIERTQMPETSLAAIFDWFGRPRVVLSMLAVATLLGTVAGSEISTALQSQYYLQSVNPYAQTR